MSSAVSVDEFQALEQRVVRAIEIVRGERAARATAEAEAATLREQMAAQALAAQDEIRAAKGEVEAALSEAESAQTQIGALNQERDQVRQRVEKLLHQMDELL